MPHLDVDREHLPRPRGLPGRLQPARAGPQAGPRAAGPARPLRDLADPDRRRRCRRPRSRSSAWPGRSRTTPGCSSWTSRPRCSTRRRSRTCSGSSASLTAEGVAVVYISHRLEEIRQIGDRITVLKDGRTVATGLAGRGHPDRRADQADDRPVHRVRLPAAARDRAATAATSVLEVRDLGLAGVFSGRRPHRARRRDRRPGRPGRRRPLRDPRDAVRRPPGQRPAPSPSTASGCAAAR